MSNIIKEFCAHPIDKEEKRITRDTIPQDANLDTYISQLIKLTAEEEETRQFHFAQDTTKFEPRLQRCAMMAISSLPQIR